MLIILHLKKDPGVWTNLGNVVLAYLLQHLRLQKTNKNAQRAPIPIIFTYLIFFPGLEKNRHCERKWWHEYYIMNLHFLAQPALWYWMRMDTIFNGNVFFLLDEFQYAKETFIYFHSWKLWAVFGTNSCFILESQSNIYVLCISWNLIGKYWPRLAS